MRRERGAPWALWLIGISAAVALLALAGALIGLVLLERRMAMPGPTPPSGAQETVVLLERGQSLSAIAEALKAAGVIESATLFKLGVLKAGAERELKAGEYAIPAAASMRAILDLLREGRVLLHKLTIPEGLTTAQILRLIEADPVLTGALGDSPPEGALLPDTYLFPRSETRAALVKRMAEARRRFLEEAWATRAPGLPLKTPEEALVLASIVEKETGIAAERPLVAGVFINRLKRGMRLQSDPTIIYGLTGGEPLNRGIRVSEIARVTPYNTYQIDGLPPTPICNPGREAIHAVLNPPDTNYLFFVADGTGGHAFAATEAEHARNTAKWRAIEKSRAQQQGD